MPQVWVSTLGKDLLMTWTHRAVVPLLALLLIGGCSGADPEPKFEPTPSFAPTATVDPTAPPTGPVEPTLPTAAKADTKAGAEAFVRYFIEVLNFAQKSGDVDQLDRISTAKCAACAGYVKAISDAYMAGGRIEGGDLKVSRIRELPLDYGADWGAFARGESTPQVIFDGSGDGDSFPGGKFSLYVYSKWVDGGWAMQWMRTPA